MPLIRVKNCLNCDGASHEWVFTSPTLRETREVLETKAGQSVQEFLDGLDTMNGSTFTALMFLLHKRIGVVLKWQDVDLDFEAFDIEDTEEELAEAKAAEEAGKAEAETAEEAPED